MRGLEGREVGVGKGKRDKGGERVGLLYGGLNFAIVVVSGGEGDEGMGEVKMIWQVCDKKSVEWGPGIRYGI